MLRELVVPGEGLCVYVHVRALNVHLVTLTHRFLVLCGPRACDVDRKVTKDTSKEPTRASFGGHCPIRRKSPIRREWLCAPLNSPDTRKRRKQTRIVPKTELFQGLTPTRVSVGWESVNLKPQEGQKKQKLQT